MGAQGSASIGFGAFPGTHEAVISIAQPSILIGSLAEAWLVAIATADHSADEHYAEFPSIRVFAGPAVAGVGFDIFARYEPLAREPLTFPGLGRILRPSTTVLQNSFGQPAIVPSVGGFAPRIHGLWTVAWVWN